MSSKDGARIFVINILSVLDSVSKDCVYAHTHTAISFCRSFDATFDKNSS